MHCFYFTDIVFIFTPFMYLLWVHQGFRSKSVLQCILYCLKYSSYFLLVPACACSSKTSARPNKIPFILFCVCVCHFEIRCGFRWQKPRRKSFGFCKILFECTLLYCFVCFLLARPFTRTITIFPPCFLFLPLESIGTRSMARTLPLQYSDKHLLSLQKFWKSCRLLST